jgi:uncharacterized protein (TIGR00106 family)
MRVMIDPCVVPMGVGVSVSKYIAECKKILNEAGLETHSHAYGTNVAGDWDDVFTAVRRYHERVHDLGAPRITTTIKVATRTDRVQTMNENIVNVQQKL